MGRRAFAITNVIVAILFLVSAALQLNDPDPGRWIVLYVAAAVACLLASRSRAGWWLAVAVAVASLGWAIVLSPILPEVRPGDLAKSMKAESPQIELGRELLGLLIVCAWMVAVAAVTRGSAADRRAAGR